MSGSDQFLVLLTDDDGEHMELLDEARLASYVDGADYLPVSVETIYVLRAGKLIKCEFGKAQSADADENSIIYAYLPLYADGKQVATLPLTDH